MSKLNPNEKFKTKIGGQALIEGIMMRGVHKAAMACRLPDGSIDVDTWDVKSIGKDAPWYRRVPFVRGCVNFVSSLYEGYKCLMKSAEKQGDDVVAETKFEKWIMKTLGDKAVPVMSGIAIFLALVLVVVLFMFLPMFITGFADAALGGNLPLWVKGVDVSPAMPSILKTTIEGVLKIGIFIVYLAVTAKNPDIKRTYMYHGAEHKTISCYEAGDELTVENVKKYKRFHPRCGTSFLFIVLIISILVFSVVTWDTMIKRILLKVLLLPVVCGIAYEIIRLAGKYDNPLTRAISAPGMALQRLTTKEPEAEQIECAIAAIKPCLPENSGEDEW